MSNYIGTDIDTKPTGVPVGSTYFDITNNRLYRTYDGMNWVLWAVLDRDLPINRRGGSQKVSNRKFWITLLCIGISGLLYWTLFLIWLSRQGG